MGKVAAFCLFAKEALNFNESTLAPVEAERGLVLEVGYIIHDCRRNLSRIKLNYILDYIFTNFDQQLI